MEAPEQDIKEILKDYESIALSDKQLRKLVDGKASIVLYPNLIHYDSIDDVLGPHGACFLLFEAKKNYGHWTLLFKVDNCTIEFFNPYGGFPDDSLEYIPMSFRKKSNQLHTNLSKLLMKSAYCLTYNEFPFQRKSKDTKTCGRWCAVRLLMRYTDLYDFKQVIDNLSKEFGLSGDELVTLLTMYVN